MLLNFSLGCTSLTPFFEGWMGPKLSRPAKGPLRWQWHGGISVLKGGESTEITFLTQVSGLIETLSC